MAIKRRARAAFDKALELEKNDNLFRAKALTARATLLDDAAKQIADLNEAAKLAPDEVEVLRCAASCWPNSSDRKKLGQIWRRPLSWSPRML